MAKKDQRVGLKIFAMTSSKCECTNDLYFSVSNIHQMRLSFKIIFALMLVANFFKNTQNRCLHGTLTCFSNFSVFIHQMVFSILFAFKSELGLFSEKK